jgi:RimJ/RimL family protein N-acetyltransferase
MREPVLRPATLDDAGLAADLMTAAYPRFAEDPIVTRYRWGRTRRGWSAGRYIAEIDGCPIAFVDWLQGPPEQDPDRHCQVGVALDRSHLDVDLLTFLWRWVAAEAEANGALQLEGYAGEDEPEMIEALVRAGFERDRLEKVWGLDLKQLGGQLVRDAGESRSGAAQGGVQLSTLGEWRDAQAMSKLHALDGRTRKDIPTTFPILPETLEDFTRRASAPDRPHDRWWIALDGDRPVAMSYLRFPPVRGTVWTGYTCCDPEYRGRGIARAVKLQSLAQAVRNGVAFVYTDNDSENAPMLHINQRLGYKPCPGFVSLLKRVSNSRA